LGRPWSSATACSPLLSQVSGRTYPSSLNCYRSSVRIKSLICASCSFFQCSRRFRGSSCRWSTNITNVGRFVAQILQLLDCDAPTASSNLADSIVSACF
jgi:hypothetical protein